MPRPKRVAHALLGDAIKTVTIIIAQHDGTHNSAVIPIGKMTQRQQRFLAEGKGTHTSMTWDYSDLTQVMQSDEGDTKDTDQQVVWRVMIRCGTICSIDCRPTTYKCAHATHDLVHYFDAPPSDGPVLPTTVFFMAMY